MSNFKRKQVRGAFRLLFALADPKSIVRSLIFLPVLRILEMLGRWCHTLPIAEGERAVLVFGFRTRPDGSIHTSVYQAALLGDRVRLADGYDPEAILETFTNSIEPAPLAQSIALSIFPLTEAEREENLNDELADEEAREKMFLDLINNTPKDL